MLVGYMRVSTAEQSTDLQRDALVSAGVDERSIYLDKAAGKRDDRPGLDACLKALREGDTLVIWKLDRLGRSLRHLVATVQELVDRRIGFRVLTGQGANIDTSTPSGKLVFGIFAALAEFERELIVERTQAGLAAARQRGRPVGRKRRMTPSKVQSARQLLLSGVPPREVARNLGVSIPTLYRWIPASSR